MPSLDLTDDEITVLEKYRRAKEMIHASLEVNLTAHVQDGVLVHINLTEKYRPVKTGMTQLRETNADGN